MGVPAWAKRNEIWLGATASAMGSTGWAEPGGTKLSGSVRLGKTNADVARLQSPTSIGISRAGGDMPSAWSIERSDGGAAGTWYRIERPAQRHPRC